MTIKIKEITKFEVRYKVGKEAFEHGFAQRGLAFALAERKANDGKAPRIDVHKFVAVPEKNADRAQDHYAARRWWRQVQRWEFFPDGTVQLAA